MNDNEDPPDFLLKVDDAELQHWGDHPLVTQIAPVTVNEGDEEVEWLGFWLRETTDEEASIDREFAAKPDRDPETHVTGDGVPPEAFWELFPRIEALDLRIEYDTGWWEAQIWLRPN